MSTEQTAVTSLNRNSICPETSLHRIVSSVCESCSIPKARWRSRWVVTQLARPLLSTGQNNYLLEWKPSLQGRDGPRNGCKRSPAGIKYCNIWRKLWDFMFFYSLHLNDFESVKRNQRIGQHSTNVNFKFFWNGPKFVQGCTFGGRNKIQSNL